MTRRRWIDDQILIVRFLQPLSEFARITPLRGQGLAQTLAGGAPELVLAYHAKLRTKTDEMIPGRGMLVNTDPHGGADAPDRQEES